MVTNLLRVQQMRRDRHLPVAETSHHLVFTGNPGTGKTTVARLLAEIYRTLGVVDKGQLIETERAGLVAGFVGQTAIKTTEVFDSATGGVLLIDEAYALLGGQDGDFGREAVDTLVKLLEDHRDSVAVIVAGYPDEMAEFLDANPGLRSRFPRTITFPDYTTDELLAIFEGLGKELSYQLTPEARDRLRAALDAEPRGKGFGNGRLARNLFEAAIGRQANRVVALANPSDADLCQLAAGDLG
jgi:SpoVK/Ycf46/Vps4 family AAA+-type ATPase